MELKIPEMDDGVIACGVGCAGIHCEDCIFGSSTDEAIPTKERTEIFRVLFKVLKEMEES